MQDYERLELFPGSNRLFKPAFSSPEEERAHSEQAHRNLMVSYGVLYVKHGRFQDLRFLSGDIRARAERMRKVYLRHHPEEAERVQLREKRDREIFDAINRPLRTYVNV
ncbi:hypothetical protein KA107_00455 [Candidatus Pacearchaeota archaeon]|nr:hypothetical protein [Candidatus Pacearchaeota archaeon]